MTPFASPRPSGAVLETVFAVLLAATAGLRCQDGNSMQKIRPEPSAMAARAGEAVGFGEDLEEALELAAETGKPVFWYVPTLRSSPMDRQVEIDRYAMAGPFSDPRVVALLQQHFVPVKQVAGGEAAKRFDLRPGKFIEPGWLILDSEGEEIARAHSIVTWSGAWVTTWLARAVGVSPNTLSADFEGGYGCPARVRAGAYAASRNAGPARVFREAVEGGQLEGPEDELMFWRGVMLWVERREDEARRLWKGLGEAAPDSPWAFKAAAEAEGHGPFVRGFEVFGKPLLFEVMAKEATSMAPAGAFTREQVEFRGKEFLMAMQRSNGGFTECRYDFGGTDSLPNVHVAVSALVARQWLRLPESLRDSRLEARLRELFRFVTDDANLATSDSDELLWAYTFRIRFLCEWLGAERDAGARTALDRSVAALLDMQRENGAWFHEYPNPFAIATALVALAEAADAGVSVPTDAVRRGVAALRFCRSENGAFTYGFPRSKATRGSVPGSAGRMPLCETALALWDAEGKRVESLDPADTAEIEKAIVAAETHYDELAKVRKYDDHASRLGYGGFFFWFDVLARCEALRLMPEGEKRTERAQVLQKSILDLAEVDGAFVDSHELGRVYGTACALLALSLTDGL